MIQRQVRAVALISISDAEASSAKRNISRDMSLYIVGEIGCDGARGASDVARYLRNLAFHRFGGTCDLASGRSNSRLEPVEHTTRIIYQITRLIKSVPRRKISRKFGCYVELRSLEWLRSN